MTIKECKNIKQFVLDVYETPLYLPVDFENYSKDYIVRFAYQLKMEKGPRPLVYYCQYEENAVFGRITKKRCFGTMNCRVTYKNRHKYFNFFRVGNIDGPKLETLPQKYENLRIIDQNQTYDLFVGLDVIDYFCIRGDI